MLTMFSAPWGKPPVCSVLVITLPFWRPTIDTRRKLSKHSPYTNPKPCGSKIHSQTFFRGLRASGDEKKFQIKIAVWKFVVFGIASSVAIHTCPRTDGCKLVLDIVCLFENCISSRYNVCLLCLRPARTSRSRLLQKNWSQPTGI